MSGRLFLLSVVAACSSKPEADPAKVHDLAAQMAQHMPAPSAVPECKPADFALPNMSFRTLMTIGAAPIADDPEHSTWINPPDLDAPAARVLADPAAETKAKRQAAAELLRAPGWLVYHMDLVNAPMALCVKELKRGTLNVRAVRFDSKTSLPVCVKIFYAQNDQAVSDAAIAKSDRPGLDPRICDALKDDLREQLLKKVAELRPAPTR